MSSAWVNKPDYNENTGGHTMDQMVWARLPLSSQQRSNLFETMVKDQNIKRKLTVPFDFPHDLKKCCVDKIEYATEKKVQEE